jgi:hypothetical protein
VVLCSSCGEYSRFGEGTLEPLDPALVSEAPAFAAPTQWTDMQAPLFGALMHPVAALQDLAATRKEGVRVVEAKWPQVCCVCGKPATRTETISQSLAFTPHAGPSARRRLSATLVADGVPHCAEHKAGARFERVIRFGDWPAMTVGLFFRSHAYQIAFRKLNPWKWRP